MRKAERRLLQKLRDASEDGVLLSSIGKSCHSLLLDLEQCSAVSKRLIKRAIRVKVFNREAFDCFVESRFPLGVDVSAIDIPDRATAVEKFGDAKAIKRGAEEGILVRSVHRDSNLVSSNGASTLAVGELSAAAGGAAFRLTTTMKWTFPGSVVVVENAEAFWRYEQVLPDIELAVYTSGNMSARMVDWLVDYELLTGPLLHWGDYDPQGVAEYLRLADHRPDVSSFVPKEIDELMKYGNRSLLLRQSKILESIRKRADKPHVAYMLALFDKYNCGLEQECLLDLRSE